MTTTTHNPVRRWIGGVAAIVIVTVIFIVPFIFIFLTASKNKTEAAERLFTWPTEWKIVENLQAVLSERNGIMVTALRNSLILTVASVAITVVLASLIAFVIQRRRDRVAALVSGLFLAGLIIPPAVVPTIFLLQALGLFKTLAGLILVEVAFAMPFAILVFVAFVSVIPRELDEAALMDGATPFRLYRSVILPLLRPAMITIIVVLSVAIYNDFVNPLYFLPGNDLATVQLTLYNFQSQSLSQFNLLFMDILLITIPPLVLYIFFNRQIVAGLTSGAVKG